MCGRLPAWPTAENIRQLARRGSRCAAPRLNWGVEGRNRPRAVCSGEYTRPPYPLALAGGLAGGHPGISVRESGARSAPGKFWGYSGPKGSKIIGNAAALATKDPYYISLAAVIYKTVNKDFADVLLQSSDEDSDYFKQISASWELGFNDFVLAVGSKNLKEDRKSVV